MSKATFGAELRRLREERGLSLKKFAKLVHYDPGYLSKIENGLKPPTGAVAIACDQALDTGGQLALVAAEYADSHEHRLRPGGPPASYPIALWEPDEVVGHALELTGFDLLSRREAVTDGTAILVGTLLVDPLRSWLFPLASVSGRELRGLSADEVAAMEAGFRYLRTWARQSGGGMARNTVAAQLNELSARLKSVRSGLLRDRAFLVGAQLARLAASLAWDADSPPRAQRYYVLAVEMAHVAHNAGYAALALADLARQSLDLGNPHDALELVQLAQYGSRHSSEARLRAFLFTRESWAFAQLNRSHDFRRAVAHAEELFDESNAASCPTWLTGFDQAELFGVLGARYRDLALASGDPRHAHVAERYIKRALSVRAAHQIRNQTLDLIGLARTHLITAEVEQGCLVARQAVEINNGALQGRPKRKLQDFCRELAPYQKTTASRDFIEYLHDLPY